MFGPCPSKAEVTNCFLFIKFFLLRAEATEVVIRNQRGCNAIAISIIDDYVHSSKQFFLLIPESL